MATTKTTVEKGQAWGTWVWIKWKQGAPSDAWKPWKENKSIKSFWSTAGNWDGVLWIDLSDPNQVETFVWDVIRSNKWVDRTETTWSKKYW